MTKSSSLLRHCTTPGNSFAVAKLQENIFDDFPSNKQNKNI